MSNSSKMGSYAKHTKTNGGSVDPAEGPMQTDPRDRFARQVDAARQGAVRQDAACQRNAQQSRSHNRALPYASSPHALDRGPAGLVDARIHQYDQSQLEQYRPENYTRRGGRSRSNRRKVLGIVLACLFVGVAILGVSAFVARGAVSDMNASVNAMAKQLLSGDMQAAASTAEEVASSTNRLNLAVGHPLWAPLTLIPVYGNDVSNVRKIAAVANELAHEVLVPYVSTVAQKGVGRALREDKSLDAFVLQTLVQELVPYSDRVAACAYRMNEVGPSEIRQVGKQANRMINIVGFLDGLCMVAPDLAEHLPGMLGADGYARTYLLIAQTNAEIRATGGYPGALGPMYVEDGHITLGDFYNIHAVHKYQYADWAVFDPYAYLAEGYHPPITEEEMTLFGLRLTRFPGDLGYNPDFPRLGETFKWIYDDQGYLDLSGVIAIDPILLQSMLEVVGGVTASDGTEIDGSNAARLLMHDIYYRGTNAEQDAFFAEAASLAFDKIMDGLDADVLRRLAGHVVTAAQQRGLSIWMADPVQEAIMQRVGCSGEVTHDETKPVLGVYVNDDSWSKLFWYLKCTTKISDPVKNPDGTQTYQVTTTLTNNITPEEEVELPDVIAPHNWRARSAGDMVAWIHLYAPQGGSISNVQAKGFFNARQRTSPPLYGTISPDTADMTQGTYEGLEVWYCQTQIASGEATVLSYTVTTSPQAQTELGLDTTPTAQRVAGW